MIGKRISFSNIYSYSIFSRIVLIALVYFSVAKFSLYLSAVHTFAAPVWPPTGIAIASLFLLGYRFWPAIFLGAFLVNFVTGASFWVSIGIGMGNAMEGLTAAYLLNRFGFNKSIERLKDALLLILSASILATMISASIGVTTLLLGGVIKSSDYNHAWLIWWIGDVLGGLVVAPFIFVWVKHLKLYSQGLRVLEVCLVFLVLVGTSLIAFTNVFGFDARGIPIAYIAVPPLIWLAIRFGQQESVTGSLFLSIISIWGTVNGHGVFSRADVSQALLLLQGYIGVHVITVLLLAAVVAERKAIERKKDEFISIASHELKTPVAAIKAYSQILEKTLKISGKRSLYFTRMAQQIGRLVMLVDDLLDFNKIVSDKLSISPELFFMDELIETVLRDSRLAYKKRKIIFRKDKKNVQVMADRYRVSQVLVNLISNAVKFSRADKNVIISLNAGEQKAIISVKDFGIGIDKKLQKDVFEKFFQGGKNVDGKISGLGLGLYISSEIIKQHGGRINIKSKDGKGSTFSFSLPISH